MKPGKILTNSDLDALVSAMLLKEQFDIPVSKVEFVHPMTVEQGKTSADEKTVVANLPYVRDAGMWFDHHKSNIELDTDISGRREIAPSCARVIANHFDISDYTDLLNETDRIDSGRLTAKDLTAPQGYMLLSCTIPGDLSGPDEIHYNRDLIDLLGTKDIREILSEPRVSERVQDVKESFRSVKSCIRERLAVVDNVIVVDLRDAESPRVLDPAYKFLHYGLEPECNVSIRIYHPDLNPERTRFQVGRSLLNRSCSSDIAAILKPLGGGGHEAAGGVTVNSTEAVRTLENILENLREESYSKN